MKPKRVSKKITDWDVENAMLSYGGTFVICLGEAARRADEVNHQKIKDTWPEYWKEYTAIAEHMLVAGEK